MSVVNSCVSLLVCSETTKSFLRMSVRITSGIAL